MTNEILFIKNKKTLEISLVQRQNFIFLGISDHLLMRNGTDAGFTDVDYSICVEASGEYERQDQGSGSFDIICNIECEITIPKP